MGLDVGRGFRRNELYVVLVIDMYTSLLNFPDVFWQKVPKT